MVKVWDQEKFDLDQPIYRIFPLWFFEQALRIRSLSFISPKRWPDPYEDICSNIFMTDRSKTPWSQKELGSFLSPVYAQCWSFENNSDILLRAYSNVTIHPVLNRNIEPANEGVRVSSTPRKLIRAINEQARKQSGVHFFMGKVKYAVADQITGHIVNTLAKVGAKAMGSPDLRAEMLFLKREYFRHEDEVRILAIFENRDVNYDVYNVQFDPNGVFDSVEFDPRLVSFERLEREASARALGYEGAFTGQDAGIRILWQVPLDNGWGEDDD